MEDAERRVAALRRPVSAAGSALRRFHPSRIGNRRSTDAECREDSVEKTTIPVPGIRGAMLRIAARRCCK